MKTTGRPLDPPPPGGCDPLGSAWRLRDARLDPDVMPARAAHVAVDLVVLLLLLAVPGLTVLLVQALQPSSTALTATALTLSGAAVLLGLLVEWPRQDGGRTPGMRWAGLRVVDDLGAPPGRWALAVRAATLPVDLLVGLVLVLLREDRRRLGDLLAGTQVVRDLGATAVPAPRRGRSR